jgi:hypothetical protein
MDFAGSANVNGTQLSHPGTVRFLTASTERMRINASGNVNIGTGATDVSALAISRNSSTASVAASSSIVLSNRNTGINGTIAGGIFIDTYRDIADPHYSGGIWFTRNQTSGNLASSSDIVFGAMENNSASALPTERLRISATGPVTATVDMRAPIFYDSNNTAYYIDAASTSNLNDLNVASGNVLGAAITFNNMNQVHGQQTDFNAITNFGVRYVQGSTNGPGISGATQYYGFSLGLGSNYPYSDFASQFYWPRTGVGGLPYPSVRFREAGTWSAWSKIYAGWADAPSGATFAASGDFRAPIFYDSNNTGYYVDPASGSVLGGNISILGGRNITLSTSSGSVQIKGDTGGWSNGTLFYGSSNTYRGGFGALGGVDSLSYFWVGTDYNNAGLYVYPSPGNYVESPGSFRAPIFYDSNNTGYYLDPNSGGLALRTSGYWIADSTAWGGDINGKIQYHGNNWYFSAADSWIFRASSGAQPFTVNQSGVAIASGDMRAPIFYDNNNTAYFCDPNSVSSLYGVAVRGDVDSTGIYNQLFLWNSGGTTTSAIGFKSSGGAFVSPTGNGDGYNTYLTMDTAGRGWVFRRGTGGTDFSAAFTSGWILNNGIWQAQASMRSPIFYDSNDTSYYLDPATNSRLNQAQFVNRISIGDGNGTPFLNAGSPGVWLSYNGGVDIFMGSESSTVAGFYISGNWRLRVNSSGDVTAGGNVTAYSDARLKKDVETIGDALGLVRKMRGVTYTRIDTDKAGVGVIAQEMLEVVPQVVQQGIGEDDTLSVAYGNLVGVLIEAIKELEARVAELEGK